MDKTNREKPKAVLFDLDGVIIDSLPDITASINAVLARQGLPVLSEETVVHFVGNGARNLLGQSFEESARRLGKAPVQEGTPEFEDIFTWYVAYYRDHSAVKTRLYPGARELLESLKAQEIPMGLVSNKPRPITLAALENLGVRDFFSTLVGPELLHRIKPDPEGMCLALEEINTVRRLQGLDDITPAETLMVGDSDTDIQAGKAFGCRTCAVTGGYGDTGDLLAQGPDVVVVLAGELRP
jgi:phosphoglycolate phosphatase